MQKLRYPPPGSAPTTVVIPSGSEAHPTKVKLIEYDAHSFIEKEVDSIDELADSLESQRVTWVNVEGFGSVELVQQLGQRFRIHPLVIADVFTLSQRPHLDEYDRQIFVLLQTVHQKRPSEVVFEQLSVLIGERFVITFQRDAEHDVFDPIRIRLREGGGNARFLRSDYLAYTLIDAAVDHYFPAVEKIGNAIEEMEEILPKGPTREKLKQVHDIRKAVALLRRAVWPQQEILTHLLQDDSGLLSDRTKPFIRDTYDHVLALVDLLESYRDAALSLVDLYTSSLATRTHEMLRVMMIITSIFIPPIFIAAVYGMNSDRTASPFNLAELVALGVMALVAGGVVLYFKCKRWL